MTDERGSTAPAAAAAALAGLAEGVVWFFPVRRIDAALGGSLEASAGALVAFAAGFAAAAAAGAASGGGVLFTSLLFAAGTAIGVAEGLSLATAQPGGLIVALVVSTGLAARAGWLGVRDWREPAQVSFGVGAVALLGIAVGGGLARRGGGLVALALPLFFSASLASRGVAVRLADGPSSRHSRRVAAGVAAVLTATGAAALLGGSGGAFRRAGLALAPALAVVFEWLLTLVTWLAAPILWLAARARVDVEGLREALRDLGAEAERRAAEDPPDGGLVQRLLGLFLAAAVLLLAYRLVRTLLARAVPRFAPAEPREEAVANPASPGPREATDGRPRRRRQRPPADRVRRWYRDALMALERLRLPRPPETTPSEYARLVAATYPDVAEGFARLTAAYESVRYGARVVAGEELRNARRRRDEVIRALRNAPPVDAGSEDV